MKNLHLNICIIIGLILFSTKNIHSQSPPAYIANSLQSILNNSLPVGIANSGVVMGVTVPGKWSWHGASGYAISGMDSLYPATIAMPDSKFRVGSITKTMAAACIMKLEESGLLNIEDPISNYLRATLINDTISSSGVVKIRHLLNHTSGIANSSENLNCQNDVLNNPLSPYSYEDAIYCGASQGEIFPPEFAWAYSNTNYSILAMIIEKVSGMTYKEYLTQNIINPLGLQNTEIPVTPELVGNYMGCYWNIGTWIDLSIIHPSIYRGWADIVSNTEDLNIFYKNLLEGNVVSNSSLNKMKLIDPASFDYGLGIDFFLLGGDDYYGHTGEVANTSSMFYSDLTSGIAPDGYYISFNFNVQGVDMSNLIDIPVYDLLNNNLSNTTDLVKDYTEQVHIYPNPATEYLFINNYNEFSNYIIYDISGNILDGGQIDDTQTKIDLSKYISGMYFITIESNNSINKFKFTIK